MLQHSRSAVLAAFLAIVLTGCSTDEELSGVEESPDLAKMATSVDCLDYSPDRESEGPFIATSGTCTFEASDSDSAAQFQVQLYGFRSQDDLDSWYDSSEVFQGSGEAIVDGPRWLMVGDPAVLVDVADRTGLNFSG